MLHGVLVWESATKTALTPGKDLSSPNEYSAEFGSFQEQHTYTQRTNTTNNNNVPTRRHTLTNTKKQKLYTHMDKGMNTRDSKINIKTDK